MFVRKKQVKGKHYAYLVKNKWTSKGPRQKVVSYIGAVHNPDRVSNKGILECFGCSDQEFLNQERILELVDGLIQRELINHGFKLAEGVWVNGELRVDLEKGMVSHSRGQAALAINEGYLCKHTIRALKKLFVKENVEGKQLAEAILEAGIEITPENFVGLYSRLMPYNES